MPIASRPRGAKKAPSEKRAAIIRARVSEKGERPLSLEEIRTAKHCFALLHEDRRAAKYLSDLARLLLDRKCDEALPLIKAAGRMFDGHDKKSVRPVFKWLADQVDLGNSQAAYEITDELLEATFRFSPHGMYCWSEYRRRFEREFPEVVHYTGPLEIALTRYASLVVHFHVERKRERNPIYRLAMERSRDIDADLTFTSFDCGAGEEMRITWPRAPVPTVHFFDHKAFRIELPRRGQCQVDFTGDAGPLWRFTYDTAPARRSALLVADKRGRFVRVYEERRTADSQFVPPRK